MRLLLDTSKVAFTVTRAPEARKDFGKDVQKVDRDTGRPQWVVEVLAQDSERGEVIRVTVAGDQPKVNQGQPVRFEDLEAIAWNNNGKSGVAYRAAAIHPASRPEGRVSSLRTPRHASAITRSRPAIRPCPIASRTERTTAAMTSSTAETNAATAAEHRDASPPVEHGLAVLRDRKQRRLISIVSRFPAPEPAGRSPDAQLHLRPGRR